ncbi:hypothetical protein P4130_26015, partial [Bacillus thuringiensis]|nr:hypothetical protein [Bacillus thuringiensis]
VLLYRSTEQRSTDLQVFWKANGAIQGVPPAFRKKTTLRKSELKNQKIYHYSKTHTVSFFIQKIIQHNINCVVLGVIININLGV